MEFSPFSHFNWLLELPLGVAVTIESESGLIADTQIDNGFLLVRGGHAEGSDRQVSSPDGALLWGLWNLEMDVV